MEGSHRRIFRRSDRGRTGLPPIFLLTSTACWRLRIRRGPSSTRSTLRSRRCCEPDTLAKWAALGVEPVSTTPGRFTPSSPTRWRVSQAAQKAGICGQINLQCKNRDADFEKLEYRGRYRRHFTDLLAFDQATGQIHQAKCLSTPPDFATGVLDGVHKAAVALGGVEASCTAPRSPSPAIERTGAAPP